MRDLGRVEQLAEAAKLFWARLTDQHEQGLKARTDFAKVAARLEVGPFYKARFAMS
jgi:hypothetical protein